MKISFPFLFWAAVCGLFMFVELGSAQTPPRLELRLSAGQPTLSITGETGAVYSIQSSTGLSPSNQWVDRAILQVQGTNDVWTDASAPAPRQQFYRAVSVFAPADTNLVLIPPGTFTMGSPEDEASRGSDETQHVVTISRGFWMGKYLVTQADYLAVVGNNPSWFTPDNGYVEVLTLPVESVSWFDATNYCALRTQHERVAGLIPTKYAYRLPTESEWEYADRAGTTTAFYLGSGLYSGQANFNGQYGYDAALGAIANPNGLFYQVTTGVGSYPANPWGLYDMIGNVCEWCQDWYGDYPTGSVVDPQGPASGSSRVNRGGSWDYYPNYCRSAQRFYSDPGSTLRALGFRVVLAPAQP